MEELEISKIKVLTLKGSDNYPQWESHIATTLLSKGIMSCIRTDPISPVTTAEQLKFDKAFAIIFQSLSETVQATLPASVRDWTSPSPKALWDEIKRQHSASTGARQAALFQSLARAQIIDGEDPMPTLAAQQSAHTQLNSSGEIISDKILAFCMTLALPESYATTKQNLWMRQPLSSSEVKSAVQAEFERRKNEESASALTASKRPVKRITKPRDMSKYCDHHRIHGHSNSECFNQQKSGKQDQIISPTARIASLSLAEIADIGPASAFHATATASAYHAKCDRYEFIIDSGASHHMCNDASLLSDLKPAQKMQVRFGNSAMLPCSMTGTIYIAGIAFPGALYIPGLDRNLISVSATPAGLEWRFAAGNAQLCQIQTRNQLLSAPKRSGLYVHQEASASANIASAADLQDIHERLGHLNISGVLRVVRSGRMGNIEISASDAKFFQCQSCILGKTGRLPSLPSDIRASAPLEIVHIDLWGPARVPSINGARYFLTCYDDFTRKAHLYFLKQKSGAFEAIQQYIALVERQLSTKVKTIRSDNGGEFSSNEWKTFIKSHGIQHIQVPPDAHTQNGRVERLHLTILNGIRTVLVHSGLPQNLWAEAANYVAYTRNRTPCGPKQEIPEDKWQKRKCQLAHLQPFGCKAFFRNHTEKNKLAPRYQEGILVGYQEATNNHRIYQKETGSITISRDVLFANTKFNSAKMEIPNLELNHLQSQTKSDQFVLLQDDSSNMPLSAPTQGMQDVERFFQKLANEQKVVNVIERDHHRQIAAERRASAALPLQQQGGDESNSDTSSDELNLRDDEEFEGANVAYALLATNTPQTYLQARNSGEWEHWKTSMDSELAKMDKYGVWNIVDRSNQRVLKGKWVYTRKIDGETGQPSTYKARFVAKGYSQIEGLDFNELFASVAHKDTIRVFLALVNHFNLECDQVDIIAAFLNGDLEEEIYMEPPEGSNIPAGKVLRLRKSLYGLKQSPRCFNKALDHWLRSQGLKPTSADPCLYYKFENGNFLMLSVHVDDQLIACNNRKYLDAFKITLNAEFECKDSGPVSYFLGFNIHRDRTQNKLFMSQEHYLESILDRFGMSDCNPARTPLPTNFRPIPATDTEYEGAKHYPFAQAVGAILYASTITRPDLAFPASLLSRYISKYNTEHWKAAKHLLRYIRGTTDLCLTFNKENSNRIALGYADADWGGDLDTRRSTTGYIFKVYGGVVAWKSRRQNTVALSTTEAELMASSEATRQAIWLRQLLSDLQLPLEQPLPILNDNNGAIALSKNPVNHDKSKHIDMRHKFVREKVEDNTVTLSHVPSAENMADLLTKSLPAETFNRLRDLLGVQQRSD